jgi:hypothetical protein
MVEPGLRVSPDLALPLDAVTETFLILGKRGAGKTNAAVVMAEEMIAAGLRTCIVDPTGVWWGLRSSADGQSPGLPVIIFGGEHADLPLSPESGTAMADLIVDEPDLVVILDLKLMSKTAQRRFMTGFLERLYHRNRDPLHLFVDEADLFAPMRGTADIARLLGAYEDVVRRGRANGIGSTSITQRPSGMHTDIRSQPEVLITLRLIGKHDIVAIDEWVRLHASDEEARDLKGSLPSLPTGTAWVWSPGWLEVLKKLQIRPRRTFDSSVGQKRIMPRKLAEVDIGALQARMAAVVDKAAQDDPAALRRKIADLQRQVKTAGTADPPEVARLSAENQDLRAQLAEAEARPAERVEVPVIPASDRAALDQAIAAIRDVAGGLEIALSRAAAPAPAPRPVPQAPAPAPRPHRVAPVAAAPAEGSPPLSKAQRSVLTVLAQFPEGRTKRQLAMLAGYSAKGGGFNNSLSSLRTAGLIERGDPIRVTGEGLAALGDWEPLPEGPALIDHWMGQLSKAESAALRALLDAYPSSLTKAEVAERAGYEANGGGFNNALSRLRTLELINGRGEMRADETLASAALGNTHA